MPILFLIVFVDLVGFGIVIPLLPFFGEHFGASPAVVGLLMATYSLAQFILAPILGRLSDRVGRKRVLVASLAGAAAAYVWLGFSDALWMLFAARAFAGAMAGNISAAFAYVADVTTPANRAKGMGLIGAAFSLGFIFGPAIGGVLAGADPAAADYRTPSLVAAGLSATAMVLAAVLLKESLPAATRARQRSLAPPTRRRQMREALATPGIGMLIAMSFLAVFVFAGMETTFAMWSRRTFGWGPEQNGYLFAFVGLLSAAIQGGLVGRMARRFGEARMIAGGTVALAAGMVAVPFCASVPALIVAMTGVAIGFSLVSPSLNSAISLRVGADAQGGVMGVTRSATTLARVLGPAWAGALFWVLGKDWPYFLGALVMVGVLVLALQVRTAPATVADTVE